MAKRRCHAITKKGEKCQAAPLKDGEHCLAHSDAKTRETTGFVAENGKQGRPRKPRVTEVMAERVEKKVDEILAPYFEIVEGAVVHGLYKGELIVTDQPDLGARMEAAERLIDRVVGRPKQATEITGADGGPIQAETVDLSGLSDDELRTYRRLRSKLRAVA